MSLEVVWFDPGTTTGAVYLKVDPNYVKRLGYTTEWESLGEAIEKAEYFQYGRHARTWNGKRAVVAPPHPYPGEHGPEIEIVEQASELLDAHPEAAWGYEDFILKSANKDREFLSPPRLFFAIAYSEAVTGKGRIPFVQGTSIKSTVDDDRLKRAGLYRPGMIHANDAARHAAHFLRRARSTGKLAKQAWPDL